MEFSRFKRHALDALKGNWGKAIIASLIAGALGSGTGSMNYSFDSSDFEGTPLETTMAELTQFFEENAAWILGLIGVLSAISIIVSVIIFCLSSIIGTGYAKFNLGLVDSREVTVGTLFSYFGKCKNLIFANLLSGVYIFLWTLLCIIPGIIASFKYAMVPYILAENPDLTPREALDRSEAVMQGHKLEYFCFNLSFIGWIILSILSCGIGFIWLSPYMAAAQADFYREISGTRRSFYTA